ncbi:MAG TPA: HDIG domain-containing metalloprotein, partial [Dehalococcoidia bacterium]
MNRLSLLSWLRSFFRRTAPPATAGFVAGAPADPRAVEAASAAARAEGEQIVARAHREAAELRERGLQEEEAHRANLQETAQRLEERQQRLSARAAALSEREVALRRSADERAAIQADLETLRLRRVEALQQQAGISLSEAKAEALATIEEELREEAERRLRAHEAATLAESERRSRGAIAAAIQRLDPPEVPDPAADPLHAASVDAREKLLARDGHTLRAIEAATGCELAIEDVPGAVPAISLAGFDPVKREIARTALTWLIRDGAMNPAKVEAIIQRAQREVAASIERAGAIAAAEAACKDLPPEVMKTLGRLRYRTSYGQNQLQHAIETSRIGAMLAYELGADVYILRRSALLHDLGKAIDRDTEGTHAMLGADICRRAGMPEAIVHCIAAHHEEIEPETFEARLT